MRGRNRFFSRGIVNHIYQRPVGGEVIFYNVSDYLVFFTVFCVTASRYDVRVFKLCQMPDHIHVSVAAAGKDVLSAFVRDYTAIFVREHNRTCHREGPFFHSPFGSVPKYGDKKARSNFIYVDNNPVERRLSGQAEEYRWNYLAYAAGPHPFSEPFNRSEASRAMLRAVGLVAARHAAGQFLTYPLLQGMFRRLSRKEGLQLVDIIVSTYNVIDYEGAIRFFDSYEEMLTACHSTTGSEYDLNEVFVGKDDRWYARMGNLLMKQYDLEDIHDMLAYPLEKKYELFLFLRDRTLASPGQIAKYLRMPLRKVDGEEAPPERED